MLGRNLTVGATMRIGPVSAALGDALLIALAVLLSAGLRWPWHTAPQSVLKAVAGSCAASPFGYPPGAIGCPAPNTVCGQTRLAPDGFCCGLLAGPQVVAVPKLMPTWNTNRIDPRTLKAMQNPFACGIGHYDTWAHALAAVQGGGGRGPGWQP